MSLRLCSRNLRFPITAASRVCITSTLNIPKRAIMSSIKETVQTTLAENLGGAAHKAASSSQSFSINHVPDQSGKVAVVTGGSEGIGYAVTSTLLKHNISKVYILSPNKDVVDKAKDAVGEEMGQDVAERTVWMQCELSDWSNVKDVAQQITKTSDRIDIVVNNAARGIMTMEVTDYGLDRHMAVNHFGHVILLSHLLPLIKRTAAQGSKVRIVNVSSNAHQSAPSSIKFTSIEELNTDHGPTGQYGVAKLAELLHARYLGRHLTKEHPNILANAVHPGVVHTKMSQEDIHEAYPLAGYLMSTALAPFKKNIMEGSVSALYAATVTDRTGEYICPPAIPESGSDLAQSEELQENLMKLTKDIIKQKAGEDVTLY